jgi:hypothetical protein
MQGPVTGAARVIRWEIQGVGFITLDLKGCLPKDMNPLNALLEMAKASF